MPRSRAGYQRGLRQRSFAAGLCYQCCTRPHREGKKTCQVCYDSMLRRRNAAADGGLCREQCGRDQKPGFRRCQKCLDRRRIWARDARAIAKTSGVAHKPAPRGRPTPRGAMPSNRIALIHAAVNARQVA